MKIVFLGASHGRPEPNRKCSSSMIELGENRYLLEAEGKRVLFSGDLSTKGPQVDFPVSVLNQPLDLAVCEAAHFEATEYLPFFEGNGNLKQLCINHYSPRYLASALVLKNKLADLPVLLAQDGMEITL